MPPASRPALIDRRRLMPLDAFNDGAFLNPMLSMAVSTISRGTMVLGHDLAESWAASIATIDTLRELPLT